MLFKLIYKNMNFKDDIAYSWSIIFSNILWVIVLSVYQNNMQNHLDEKAGGINALCLFFFAVAFVMSLLFLVIARALSNNPEIIFADEPTGNLDLASALNIMQCFMKINSERHKAVVLVTHDPHIASYCNKIYFLDEGRIGWSCIRSGHRDDFYDEIMHHMASIQ